MKSYFKMLYDEVLNRPIVLFFGVAVIWPFFVDELPGMYFVLCVILLITIVVVHLTYFKRLRIAKAKQRMYKDLVTEDEKAWL